MATNYKKYNLRGKRDNQANRVPEKSSTLLFIVRCYCFLLLNLTNKNKENCNSDYDQQACRIVL